MFNSGEYKGKTLKELLKYDYYYIRWKVENFPDFKEQLDKEDLQTLHYFLHPFDGIDLDNITLENLMLILKERGLLYNYKHYIDTDDYDTFCIDTCYGWQSSCEKRDSKDIDRVKDTVEWINDWTTIWTKELPPIEKSEKTMIKYNFDEIGINWIGIIQLNQYVYVTDPCNDVDECYLYMKELDNVSPGEYVCLIKVIDTDDWGHRVSELHVVKESFFKEHNSDLDKIPYNKEALPCVIGVDSGQVGVFDANYYDKNQPDNDYENLNSWYRKVCDLTYHAGIIDSLGVVTASGYGDGSYELFTAEDSDNNVVAMKVVFIYESDEK